MSDEAYEYMPPHGGPTTRKSKPMTPQSMWDVVVPWGSEVISRDGVRAESERKALNKVLMEISRLSNVQPQRVFQRVLHEKKYKVTKSNIKSAFIVRASSLISSSDDIERIERLPHVTRAYIYEQKPDQVNYNVELDPSCTFVEAKEVTGYVQNLFGIRLLSSGQIEKPRENGTVEILVTARVSLIPTIHEGT